MIRSETLIFELGTCTTPFGVSLPYFLELTSLSLMKRLKSSMASRIKVTVNTKPCDDNNNNNDNKKEILFRMLKTSYYTKQGRKICIMHRLKIYQHYR